MCVCVCVPRTEVWVICVRLKYEVEAGPDLIPSRSGVWTLRSAGLYRYQHVEVDSSLVISERISGVRCRKLHHYSVIPFLLSLSVYSELTAIKTFTGINVAQSLHVCKLVLVWYPLARLTFTFYIYAFSRRFYPKRLTLHSSYSFTFDQLLLSLGIEPMILALLAPCSTSWATGKPLSLHGLKQKYFQHCDVTNCPPAPVSKTYRTVTPLCRIEPNREFCEPLHP